MDSFCCDSLGGCCDARRCLLLHSLPVPEPELWPVLRLCQQRAWQGQVMKQAVAQAGNRTCVELSSARSTRTRFEPFSAAISTSSSSSRSCRGAIVGLHALAEFCFSFSRFVLPSAQHAGLVHNIIEISKKFRWTRTRAK
eukprot:scaffold3058_cov134-Isochrysis_galbana.AAC.8